MVLGGGGGLAVETVKRDGSRFRKSPVPLLGNNFFFFLAWNCALVSLEELGYKALFGVCPHLLHCYFACNGGPLLSYCTSVQTFHHHTLNPSSGRDRLTTYSVKSRDC